MTIGHELHGCGPERVLVLHGWFGDHTAFSPILPHLDTDTFTYPFMDYRGYGASRDIDGKHAMAEISADAVELADHLSWDRFHIIGHSMGGMTMQRVALDATQRAKCGVAITPVPASGAPPDADQTALFSGAPDSVILGVPTTTHKFAAAQSAQSGGGPQATGHEWSHEQKRD